jgi:glycosyltransferase involved in cell wall biosynthesis
MRPVSDASPDMRAVARPYISVVMPVYDRAAYLAEAIDSILGQTHPHLELIVVDDGSTDGSREIIERYAVRDARVRPIYRDEPDVTAAMNDGIRLARGDWIARMESDDVALPDRLALTLEWAQRHDLDVCGAQAETFGDGGQALWFPESHEAICLELLFRCAFMHSSTIVRAVVLKENLYGRACVFDDYELWTRLALRYHLGNAPQVLVRYRRHTGQTSAVRRDEVVRDFLKYRFRYFYASYPGTPLADYLPLARVADHSPLPTLAELEQAGTWLVRLACSPDTRVREAMAGRWQKTCERSAGLGAGVDAVFRHFEGRILSDAETERTRGGDYRAQ